MTLTMDTKVWAEEQFGQCDLQDRRRTARLVRLAEEVLRHPAGSLPEQTENMADLKAAYRLFDCTDVTFERIAGPHWEQTRRQSPGRYLLLDDTTEVEIGICRQVSGLGPTGNGGGRGFLLHSSLMVAPRAKKSSAWPARKSGIGKLRRKRKTRPNALRGGGNRKCGAR